MSETEGEKGWKYQSLKRFLFGDPPGFLEGFAGLEERETPLRPCILAFRDNLSSAVMVGGIPFELTHTRVVSERFNQIHTAERIRSLRPYESDEDRSVDRVEEARRIASEKMTGELRDPEIMQHHAEHALSILDRHLGSEEFAESANELLRQVLVMTWGAFETFVSDAVRAMLNERPALAGPLLQAKSYKDALGGRTMLTMLEANGYDLSRKMGDVLCDAVRMDALGKIREAVSLLFADSDLDKALKDERLWLLSQQRHLIVHRRAIVDAVYLENTSDALPIGSRLTVDAQYVERSLRLVEEIGIAFAKAGIAKMEV